MFFHKKLKIILFPQILQGFPLQKTPNYFGNSRSIVGVAHAFRPRVTV